LVVARYGKGESCYIAAEKGAMYLQTGIGSYPILIREVIEYVSPDGAPYEIGAPTCFVITNMNRKWDRMVFILLNRQVTQKEIAEYVLYPTH